MGWINAPVCFSLHKQRLCVFLSVYRTKNSVSGAVYWQEQRCLFSSSFILTSVSSTIVTLLHPYQSSEWEIFPVSRFLRFTEKQGSGLRRFKGRLIWIDTKNSGATIHLSATAYCVPLFHLPSSCPFLPWPWFPVGGGFCWQRRCHVLLLGKACWSTAALLFCEWLGSSFNSLISGEPTADDGESRRSVHLIPSPPRRPYSRSVSAPAWLKATTCVAFIAPCAKCCNVKTKTFLKTLSFHAWQIEGSFETPI